MISGHILSLYLKCTSLGSVNYSGGTITEWRFHEAVIKDGIVYDGLTGSNGMPEEIYQQMFEYWVFLHFTPIP